MPASQRSLGVTDAYRTRLLATRERVEREAARRWPTIEELDSTEWPSQMAALVSQAQVEAVRVSAAYLAAFLATETGRRVSPIAVNSRRYAGRSRDGRPLSESLDSPLIGVKAALADGKTPREALTYGLNRATRMVGIDYDHAHRTALLEAIEADDRFEGWTRAVRGTCGACAGVASGVSHGLSFQVHPGCQCVSEPVISGVPNRFPRPTGPEIFAAKSENEQDEMLGPEAAALVRSGEVELADLVDHSHLDSEQDDFLTQRPVSALQ